MIVMKQTDIQEFSVLDGDKILAKACFHIEADVLFVDRMEMLHEEQSFDVADGLYRAITSYALPQNIKRVQLEHGAVKSVEEVLVHNCKK